MTSADRNGFPGLILAGGRSSRMGRQKALLPFGGVRLIDHVAARLAPQVSTILVSANDPAIVLDGRTSVPDAASGHAGPLAGIHAGLLHLRQLAPDASHLLTLPVDCPFFPGDLVDRLSAILTSEDDVALATSGGRLHPVIGLWPVRLAGRLAAWLDDPPTLKVRAFLDGEPLRILDFTALETSSGPLDPFFNVNTPEDHALALRLLPELGS